MWIVTKDRRVTVNQRLISAIEKVCLSRSFYIKAYMIDNREIRLGDYNTEYEADAAMELLREKTELCKNREVFYMPDDAKAHFIERMNP